MGLNSTKVLTIIRVNLILFGSILMGYSMLDVKPDILLKMTEFKYMFIVNLLVSMGVVGFKFIEWPKNAALVLISTLLFTILIYFGKRRLGVVRVV
jgi:hypothetical protein